jgi:hypothetical protein
MKPHFFRSVTSTLALARLGASMLILICLLLIPADLTAQGLARTRQVIPIEAIEAMNASTVPQAYVLAVNGKCEYSENGSTFLPFKVGHLFKEGDIVRTAADAQTDLFFRRTGTTIRVQPGTEMKLEIMERHLQAGTPVSQTLLHLRTGRIFSIVRASVPGSTFEIRNGGGRSRVEGGDRYIITADVTGKTGIETGPLPGGVATGITPVTASTRIGAKEGKFFTSKPSEAEKMLLDMDQMEPTGPAEDSSQK